MKKRNGKMVCGECGVSLHIINKELKPHQYRCHCRSGLAMKTYQRGGIGTVMAKLFSKLGFKKVSACSPCARRAKALNNWGWWIWDKVFLIINRIFRRKKRRKPFLPKNKLNEKTKIWLDSMPPEMIAARKQRRDALTKKITERGLTK